MPKKSETCEVHVFESRRRWAPELARQFLDEPVRVRGFRSIAELRGAVSPAGTAVAVLELDAAPADCLRWLAAQMNGTPQPATIVVGTSSTAELEPLVRELGAAAFVLDTISGESLARICRRIHTTTPGRGLPPVETLERT
jgi:hypothetical protein